MTQTWDAAGYAKHARFVSDFANVVLELLAAQPGERILDLGCGDGVLTQKLVRCGCAVVGVDASPAMIDAARVLGLDARVMSGEELQFSQEFDAVFSNAVLHWMPRADDVLSGVHRALKPGGRFVAEMGGEGCVQTIREALANGLLARGIEPRLPWYFPSAAEYEARLRDHGFRVDLITLVARSTPLPGDIVGWLETFAVHALAAVPPPDRSAFLESVRAELAPKLRDASGTWIADYTRLRFAATKLA